MLPCFPLFIFFLAAVNENTKLSAPSEHADAVVLLVGAGAVPNWPWRYTLCVFGSSVIVLARTLRSSPSPTMLEYLSLASSRITVSVPSPIRAERKTYVRSAIELRSRPFPAPSECRDDLACFPSVDDHLFFAQGLKRRCSSLGLLRDPSGSSAGASGQVVDRTAIVFGSNATI